MLGGHPGQLGRLGRADVGDEPVAHPVTTLVGHRVAGGIVGAPAPPVVGHPGAAQDGEAEGRPQRVVPAAALGGAGEAPAGTGVREVDPMDHGLLVTRAEACPDP